MNLKYYLRRFVRKYIFGQVSSGQKEGGLSAAVMRSAVMCLAAKWVDTVTVYYKYVFSLIHAIITYDVTVIC